MNENFSAKERIWDDELEQKLFTPEELAASDLRVEMMTKIARERKKLKLSQQKLEELSGVRKPIISRLEKGTTKSQIDTIIKVLTPLGLKLDIVPIKTKSSRKKLLAHA